jgi:hypothetical protein
MNRANRDIFHTQLAMAYITAACPPTTGAGGVPLK